MTLSLPGPVPAKAGSFKIINPKRGLKGVSSDSPFSLNVIKMGKKVNLSGRRFLRLTVIKETDKRNSAGAIIWECLCDCGNINHASSNSLLMGTSKSCGCLQREAASYANTTHGHTAKGEESTEYTSWNGMKDRCHNIKNDQYSDYGGRGISICCRWLGENGFENFLLDMGRKPSNKYSIDRFPNNDGNYEPNNCRWATRKDQQRGKRNNIWIEFDGRKMVLSDWSIELKVPLTTLRYRIEKSNNFKEVVEYFNKKTVNA